MMQTKTIALPGKTSCGNIHKVPKKMWRRWSLSQRVVFNGTMKALRIHQRGKFFYHPATEKRGLTRAEDQTIAWNAAWLAAEATRVAV